MSNEGETRGRELPHAMGAVDRWLMEWRSAGSIILLLDFDGTLAPIVDRPEMAALPAATRLALEHLSARDTVHVAIISGRGLADARDRVRLGGVWYAGNHGMEIHGPGVDRVHPEARAARPELERARAAIEGAIGGIDGAFVEDKGLTLSVHHRLTARDEVAAVRAAVERAVAAAPSLRMTEGKEVLEVRPRIDWDKGRAVEFLLEQLAPDAGVPILYVGDDRTDEDAFRALRRSGRGDGVIVSDPPPASSEASFYLSGPTEVAALLERLAAGSP